LQRLHQPEFRGRVIRAYRTQCTVCTLRHGELLDAAHIIADSDSAGAPVVSNGLSLCKIHHAAYDRNLLAVRPDYVVEINKSLLAEIDGPMLKHGLQEMHGRSIVLPVRRSERPDRDRLEQRYDVSVPPEQGVSSALRAPSWATRTSTQAIRGAIPPTDVRGAGDWAGGELRAADPPANLTPHGGWGAGACGIAGIATTEDLPC
jgi:hypothetical protein